MKERLQAIQDVTQGVQNTIGRLATFGESVKKYYIILIIALKLIPINFQYFQLHRTLFIVDSGFVTSIRLFSTIFHTDQVSVDAVGYE